MKCRECNKIVPKGCGKTCCEVDDQVIMDFDSKCKFPNEYIKNYEQAKKIPIVTISHANLLTTGI